VGGPAGGGLRLTRLLFGRLQTSADHEDGLAQDDVDVADQLGALEPVAAAEPGKGVQSVEAALDVALPHVRHSGEEQVVALGEERPGQHRLDRLAVGAQLRRTMDGWICRHSSQR
jgi:hypothetical protein